MKVLVCGDREWKNFNVIERVLKGLGPNTVIVEGEARGADKIARWVAENRLGYSSDQIKKYPADWKKHGKRAGPIRNRHMFDSEQPELVVAFHNDIANSKGTKDMVEYARSQGCPVTIITEDGETP